MGFGCSTLVMGNIAEILFRSAIGWRATYLLLGAATLVVLLIGSRCVIAAPPVIPSGEGATDAVSREYTTGQMVKTGAFWLLFFIIVCSNLIGTGVIGHSRYIAVEAGVAAGVTALVVGLQSVCNGLGRLAFGALFDKRGIPLPCWRIFPALLFPVFFYCFPCGEAAPCRRSSGCC